MKALKSFSYLYCQTFTSYPGKKRSRSLKNQKNPDLKKPDVLKYQEPIAKAKNAIKILKPVKRNPIHENQLSKSLP